MATLKNSDRAEVLRRVLESAFAPPFAALTERIAEHYRARLAAEHPRFLDLLADESARPYVATCGAPTPHYLEDGTRHVFARPARWERFVTAPRRQYLDREEYVPLRPDRPEIPPREGFGLVGDARLVADYLTLWERYVAARQTLSALLYSYSTREKLVADFPEYAPYLPAATQKAKLPVVVVSSVRAELSALGIPAEGAHP